MTACVPAQDVLCRGITAERKLITGVSIHDITVTTHIPKGMHHKTGIDPPPPNPFPPDKECFCLSPASGIQQDLFRFSWSEAAVGPTGQPYRKSFSTVSNQAVLLFDRARLCLSTPPPSFLPKSQEGNG